MARKQLPEEKELRKFYRPIIPMRLRRKLSQDITALVRAVEERCAKTIRECEGIPFDRIDIGGRKWIHASADIVAAAIQTKRK